jgi:hypothetical protein
VASKADLDADEWSTVVERPVLAGLRVWPPGAVKRFRESFAMAQVYAEARRTQRESEFLDALVSSPPAVHRQQLRAGGDIAAVSGERLRVALRTSWCDGVRGGCRGVHALRARGGPGCR